MTSAAAPYRDAGDLQDLLALILAAPPTGPDPAPDDLLSRYRLALSFVFTAPDLAVLIDGRSGTGPPSVVFSPADAAADLTFSMNGKTAHAFWMGELNVVTAMASGQIRLQGSLISALKVAPMMPGLQDRYRRAWADRHGS